MKWRERLERVEPHGDWHVLAWPGVPPIAELAKAGVSRVSVGSAFAFSAYVGLIEAATELRDAGTYGYLEDAGRGYYQGARYAFAELTGE